jgi:hypothetical protein
MMAKNKAGMPGAGLLNLVACIQGAALNNTMQRRTSIHMSASAPFAKATQCYFWWVLASQQVLYRSSRLAGVSLFRHSYTKSYFCTYLQCARGY